VTDKTIANLHEFIRQGIPWDVDNKYRANEGVFELRGFVTGHFFFTTLFHDEGDEEAKRRIYEAVKAEFVPTHAHHRPGLRPWAWWEWDAPEPRRVIQRDCLDPEHDDDCDGSHGDIDRLPAAEDPKLPAWAKELYFGRPASYDGFLYETQYDYLERLNLLYPEEIAIFAKYSTVINVRMQQGELAKCDPCWDRARQIAKQIDFDLESAAQRFEFWIPGDLFLDCEHRSWGGGIFSDADCER
jgi:hypothetical protein